MALGPCGCAGALAAGGLFAWPSSVGGALPALTGGAPASPSSPAGILPALNRAGLAGFTGLNEPNLACWFIRLATSSPSIIIRPAVSDIGSPGGIAYCDQR